jgi:hypothetical protein
MRKFNTFCGMMPCALVEFKADVVKIDAGKKKKCGHIEVCRFGCSCHYTDASGWAYHMKADEPTLADAIKKAKELLAEEHEEMANEIYTGNELTDDIIKENTWVVPTEDEYIAVFERFNKLLSECYHQPWYRRSNGGKSPNQIGIDNIAGIPDKYESNDLFLWLTSDNKIYVANRISFDAKEHKASVPYYQCDPIDEVKEKAGFADKSDIEFVNQLVEKVLEASRKCAEHKDMKVRQSAALMTTAVELGRLYLEALSGDDQDEIDISLLRYNMVGGRGVNFTIVDSIRRLTSDRSVKPKKFYDDNGRLYGLRFSVIKDKLDSLIAWLQGIEQESEKIARDVQPWATTDTVSLPVVDALKNCVFIDYTIDSANASQYYRTELHASLVYTTEGIPTDKITGEPEQLPSCLWNFVNSLKETPWHVNGLKC